MLPLVLDQVHALQLRQVQLDSLAHHFLPAIATARHSPHAAAFLNKVLQFLSFHSWTTTSGVVTRSATINLQLFAHEYLACAFGGEILD
jgi:hypothetical protein